jgi:hypothetical protein
MKKVVESYKFKLPKTYKKGSLTILITLFAEELSLYWHLQLKTLTELCKTYILKITIYIDI